MSVTYAIENSLFDCNQITNVGNGGTRKHTLCVTTAYFDLDWANQVTIIVSCTDGFKIVHQAVLNQMKSV